MSPVTMRVILLMIALLTIGGVNGGGLPCTTMKGECRARIKEIDGLTQLEVSCVCKYAKDVSTKLNALYPIMCPLIPKNEDSPWLNRTILHIENCNIVKENFSVDILRVLRRSYNFTITVKNSSPLRLELDNVPTSADVKHPAVTAQFVSSRISGLVRGWFTGSRSVHLDIRNCTVDVIDTQFIECSYPDGEVDINIKNTEIRTVHSFAFTLPRNGNLSVKGGKILQLESDALLGGKIVTFEAVRIDNMQKKSINIYGLHTFKMDSCFVSKIDAEALVEEKYNGSPEPSFKDPRLYVGEVIIKLNKFIVASSEAFGSLCMVKNLSFQDNYLHDIRSDLVLKSKHCSLEHNWWKSVWNNGFFCNKCQNLFEEALDEQVCALYETGWCLDTDTSNHFWNISIVDNKGDKVPNKLPVRDYMKEYCGEGTKAKNYIADCDVYSDKVPKISGRTWSKVTSSGIQPWLFVSHLVELLIVIGTVGLRLLD